MSSLDVRLLARDQGDVRKRPWIRRNPPRVRTSFWRRASRSVRRRLKAAWHSDEVCLSIAERFGTTVPTLRRIARAEGWPLRRSGPRALVWSDGELKRIERAWRHAAASQEEIARRFHTGAPTLRALARAGGWTRPNEEMPSCR